MKRVFIISGALIFVAGGANAANIINGNPLYSPVQGHFYNVFTPIEMNTKFERFVMADEFGYGITDSLDVMIQTAGSYDSGNHPEFGKWSWNHLQVGVDWSVVNDGEYQADVYGRAMQVYDTRDGLETVAYNWTVGTQFGRVTDDWTVAGIIEIDYLNDDVDKGNWDALAMTVGVQGQYLLDDNWNVVADLMFDFDLHNDYYDGERLRLKLGVNYNLDSTKYIGMYVSKDLVHSFDSAPMAFGVQFGIDF